jgi:hypothetical protein
MQCSVTYHPGPFLKQPLTSYQGFWLLITDNTHGAEVNPGFKGSKWLSGTIFALSARPGLRGGPLPR